MDATVKKCLHELGQTITEALQEIAETMLFVEIEPGPISTERCDIPPEHCAVIDFGDGIQGCFVLVASERAALKLAGALMGEERGEMDPEMGDSFGEVANMIAGGLVSRVEGKYGSVSMTPPERVEGHHPLEAEQEWRRIHLGFALDGVPFCAEFFIDGECMQKKASA
ncbi:MAG: chemotaxis protein CheX [Magnetococcales bacterium]|nr:chemotaxis protein CheX [Magnetococcales bacterium]